MDSDYRILNAIYESSNSLIYRAQRIADDASVILKVINRQYPEPKDLARFRQEYEMTLGLEKEGVVKVFALEPYQNGLAIVMEDFSAQSLDHHLEAGAMTMERFFELSIPIAQILGKIHNRHCIHKDINPSNILWNPQTNQIKLIDFGIATSLEWETPRLVSPEQMEGTLAYISPEQTGRMNRDVDYRTDLYSLGATFFHLLTGRLPFESREPMQLVHSHIARPLPVLHETTPGIDPTLSCIVAKLMAKDPEDRYQSALGLETDLKECRHQWLTQGSVEPFALGRLDELSRFRVAKKLYGREKEIEQLLQGFARASHGAAELLLVAGFSGIGKTSLVGEIHKPVVQSHGLFLTGKFDQFNRNTPYAALAQACQHLMMQVLMASETEIHSWREKILKAVGDNGEVLIRIVPELQILLGPQPTVLALDPTSAENRFHRLFSLFLSVFTSQTGGPLVLFLDDLQWADPPSLRLLNYVLSGGHVNHLLVIGAYRDNEVGPTHPLMTLLEELTKSDCPIQRLTLTPLTQEQVARLVGDTVQNSGADGASLARLCHEKTGGNPFFLKQFLITLHETGFIRFLHGQWHYDLQAIHRQGITDNVVQLMEQRIHRLPEPTQRVLQRAACIGADFDLHTLATVLEASPREVFSALAPALEIQLIIALDRDYQLAKYLDESHFVFRFIHDRVQQAAYHLIDAPSREKVHLTVGRLLLAEKGNEPLSGNLLRITDHLNLASRIIVVPGERLQLAKLNLQAGRQAKASAAFAPAFAYFTMGLTLLEDQVWNDHYGLMSNLYQEAVEGALLIADMDEMERLAGIALEHMIDVLDRAKLLKAKAIAYQGVNRLTESLAYGLEALAGLGFHFSDNPGVDEVRKSVFGGLARIEGKSIAELVAIPETTDPKYLVVMDLMVITGVTAFFIKQNLAPIIHIKGFELIFDHGAAPSASVLFAGCGVFLAGEGYYEEAYKLGQIALRLVERPNARQHLARTLQYSSGFTIFWKEHVHLAVHNINRVFDIAVENGQLDVAGLGGGGRTWHGFLVGFPLEEAERKAGHYNDALRKIKQFYVLDQARSTQQAMQNLLGQSDEPHVLAGRVCDGSQVLDSAIQLNNRQNAFAIALNQLILAYLFGKYEEALVHALQADIYMDGSPGSYSVTVFTLYDALTRLALVSISPPEVCEKLFARVAFHQQRMARWADMAPMNFAHKYHLIEAEKLRVMDRGDVARDHYDRAILLAHEHGFLNEEALALELAGCFYQGRKWTSLARHYMREARHAYACWGALAKVRDLEARFPEYLADHGVTVTPRATITLSTKTTTASLLDLPDVMMAAKVLFSETSLDVLLEKLMRLAIGNAGAQKGILVLLEEGVPVVKVEAVTERVRLLPSLSLEAQGGEAGIVAEEIVRYLLRTKENVVLDNACVEGIFAAVPYVASRKIRSVLGVPLVHHDQAIGAIYLENNLTTAAFTHQRVAMLHLIGTLAALSITNAQYVARQKKTQDSLAVSYQRIRELAAHQEEVREAEKRRIAGEIHDELGSALTRLSMDLHWLQRHPPKDKKKMGTHFDGLMGLTADIHETVRRISHTLRPPVLDQFGLLPALQWLAEQMQRHGNLKVEVTTDSQEVILDDQRKTTMFRIGQEALTNVVRHAHAQRAVISLELEEDAVVMVIRDDGIGISLDLIQKGGFGLSGMKERALRFGGNVEIETGSQGGTRVTVLLPRLESDHVEK